MIIKAPNPTNHPETLTKPNIFLAGSIEIGKAEHWQKEMGEFFSSRGMVVFDPRRDDWDSSWKQNISDPQFSQQVNWELENLETCNYVFMYFDPATQSPITLLELGFLAAHCPSKLVVVCPEGFYRKGNVDIVCNRYGIAQFESLLSFKIWFLNRQKDSLNLICDSLTNLLRPL